MAHPLDHLVMPKEMAKHWQHMRHRHIIGSKLMNLIKFGCNFDNNGICAHAKKFEHPPEKGTIMSEGCCCSTCFQHTGFLERIFSDEVEIYKKHWDNKTGFFKKGTGCTLPRSYRSGMCQQYVCMEGFPKNKKDQEIRSIAISLLSH